MPSVEHISGLLRVLFNDGMLMVFSENGMSSVSYEDVEGMKRGTMTIKSLFPAV